MDQVKVLIIDDSNVIHILLHEVISNHKYISIIGDAYNGKEGVELTKNLSPDVIIMDIDMPQMNGLEAIEDIMNEKPLPIIVFSSASKSNADISFKAIESGAVEIIEKPVTGNLAALKNYMDTKVIRSIKTFADFKVIRRIKRTRTQLPIKNHEEIINKSKIKDKIKISAASRTIEEKKQINKFKPDFPVIGIAASAGGPQTLRILIEDLSKRNITAGLIILQHMADGFMKGFCDWISQYSSLPVILPKQGDNIEPNNIYVAPGGHHLIFDENSRVSFLDSPPIDGIRPSADIMFSSMGEVFRERAIAIILTGMGHDGSEGIKKIKENKGYIISQDEESSLLFGMPKSAIETGLVDRVVNINNLSEFLEKYLTTTREDSNERN